MQCFHRTRNSAASESHEKGGTIVAGWREKTPVRTGVILRNGKPIGDYGTYGYGSKLPAPDQAPADLTLAKSSTNFCLRSDWSWPDSASASWVMFMEQNFGPHMEQNLASL